MKKTVYDNLERASPFLKNEPGKKHRNILFENFLKGLNTPVALLDVQGKIISANSSFCLVFNLTAEDIPGSNYFTLMTPVSQANAEDVIQSVLTSGKRNISRSFYGERLIMYSLSPLYPEDNDLQSESFLIAEIYETVESEAGFKTEENKYRILFNNLTEAISLHKMITDENGKIVDFTYEELNPAREILNSLPYSQKKDKTVRQINPEIGDDLLEKYADIAISGKPVELEYFSESVKRHYKVKIFSPGYGYLATIIEDLTAQKNAERELNKTSEIYRTVFENSIDGICLIDKNGAIREWNKFLENRTGFLKETAIGMKLWDIQYSILTKEWRIKYPLETLKNIWMRMIDTLQENELITKEGQYLDSKNNLVLTEDLVCPVLLNGEKFLCIIQRDLTERRTAEQKLKLNERNLEQLNATKDKLFSIIAHDLRSSFNSIMGYTQLLGTNIRKYKVEESEMYLDIINSSVQSTLSLLINLLSWARNQTGQTIFKPAPLVLYKVIDEVIELLSLSAKTKNITLNHDLSDKIEIYADRNMLKTVVQNLISNAVKFTNPGGNIRISAVIDKDKVEIVISDNGVGIGKKGIKCLFNIETNVSTAGTMNETGSGLGLIICREFVEMHGGRIWVESKTGKGSNFKFTFPLAN